MTEITQHLSTALTDRYKLERHLGEGGMATVYLAEDLKHHRKVALKVLRPELAAVLGTERFLREITTTANLRHPHILPLYDSGEADELLFYVMPYVEGETLRDLLDREKQLPLDDAFQITREVADALSYAHARGVIHRDIKPENILLESGHAVVADFGIARAVSAASGEQLTQTGMAVGTPAYMSPEQASGSEDVDGRSDLYALGCVLYEMLAGQPPFSGPSLQAVLAKRLTEVAPEISTIRPDVPARVSGVVRTLLAREPEDRYATAEELVQFCKGGMDDGGTGTGPTPPERAVLPAQEGSELGIAVLPIGHDADDRDLAALARGLTEDVTTGLGRFSYLSVTESTFGAPGDQHHTDLSATAKKLGVRYLVTGAVRRAVDTLRVSARLVDAISGQHVWSETYDRDLAAASLFDVQDDLTDRIVATVADSYGVLVRSMASVVEEKPADDFAASDWVLRTFGYRQRITPSEHAELRDGLERAVEREPGHAEVWACLAQLYIDEDSFRFNVRPNTLDRALAAARRAVDIDRSSQLAYQVLAQTHFFRRDLAAFRPAAERAMSLNSRDSNTIAILGLMILHTGEFARGAEITRRAMAINPHHAGWYHFGPLWEHFQKGEFEKALARANQVNMPGLFWQYLAVAAICGHLGRRAEAEEAVQELLRVDPDFTSHARRQIESWHYASGLLEALIEGLQAAGVELPAGEASAPGTA